MKYRNLYKSLSVILLAALMVLTICVSASCSNTTQQSMAGKYVSEEDSQEYLDLDSDGSFFLWQHAVFYEGYYGISGTYEIDGNQITLETSMGADRGEIVGNTLIDSEGEHWTKQ